MADLIITDLNGQSELLTGFKELQRHRRVNGEHSLSFILFETAHNKHAFPLVAEESILEYENNEYRIKKLEKRMNGETSVKYISAQHRFFHDLLDHYQYESISGTLTLNAALDYLLNGTGYTFSIVGAFSSQLFEKFGDDNSLSLLNKVLDTYGIELQISGKHFTFYDEIGIDSDFQFRYKHNLKSINEVINTNNLSTYIKGYGKQNEDGTYVVTAEYTSPYAHLFEKLKHAPPVKDERYTTYQGLIERLQKELQDAPEISLTIDFVELKNAGYSYEVTDIGNRVYVIHEKLGIDYKARIIEYTEFPEEKYRNSTVTLSNFKNNILDVVADLDKTKQRLDDIVTPEGDIRQDVLPEFVKRNSEVLNNVMTELETPPNGGLIGRDKTNPNNLTIFNSKGFGISKDNGATYTEAITADGFNFTVGAIGQLSANNIKTWELVVGSNVTMGSNAYLSWNNVTNQPFIPNSADQIGGITTGNPRFTHITSTGIYTGDISATTGTFTGALSGASGTFAGKLIGTELEVQSGSLFNQSNIFMYTDSTIGVRFRTSGGGVDSANLKITLSDKGNIFSEKRFNNFEVNAYTANFTNDAYISRNLSVGNYMRVYGTVDANGLTTNGGSIQSNGGHLQAGSGGLYGGFASISGSMSSGSVNSGYGSFTSLESTGTTRSRGYYADGQGASSWVYLVSGAGVRCATSFAGTSYVPVQASAFTVPSSKREYKTDIKEVEDAYNILKDTIIYEYRLKQEFNIFDENNNVIGTKDKEDVPLRYGIMLGEAAPEITNNHTEVDLYSMISLCLKLTKENSARLDELLNTNKGD